MSIKIFPSNWQNSAPDLLSLSGQTISLKLGMSQGVFFTFMHIPYFAEAGL